MIEKSKSDEKIQVGWTLSRIGDITMVFKRYRKTRSFSGKKYMAIACTQYYTGVQVSDVLSVFHSSLNEYMVLI